MSLLEPLTLLCCGVYAIRIHFLVLQHYCVKGLCEHISNYKRYLDMIYALLSCCSIRYSIWYILLCLKCVLSDRTNKRATCHFLQFVIFIILSDLFDPSTTISLWDCIIWDQNLGISATM